MSKIFFKLSDSDFFQDWTNTNLITTSDDWSGVPSIVGYRGDGLASAGRNPATITADSTVIDVNANATNPNTNTTGGVTEFQIADPVVALQGSGTAQAPNLVLYLDASGRQNLHFSVDLRDIDGSADNSIQAVAVQYRVGDTGAWTTIASTADASTGPSLANLVTHLDVDLPAIANNQSVVEIRIITADATGSDEWIGVDNLRVTSAPMEADHTPPQLASSSPVDGANAVSQNANLVLNFNELIAAGSGKITITDGAGDVRVIDMSDASQVSISGQSLVINPVDALHAGTSYHVSLDAGTVLDKSGNAWAGTGANPLDFRTIAELTHTYEIQGAGHRSEYAGQLVNTRGVVTAIDTTGTKGFYIQDMQGDGNDATSDAVFVFSTSGSTQVHVGDLVQIQGTVDEYSGSDTNNLSITEVTNLQELTIVSSGNTIAPTVIGTGGRLPPTEVIDSDHFATFNPDHDAVDFYESLEGMLVTAKNVQVIDDTYQNATFVVTDRGANASGMNDRGGLTHSAGDINPERIEIFADSGISGGSGSIFQTGDLLGDVTGVMSYFGGNYELIPTGNVAVQSRITIPEETTTLTGDAAHLTIGAYNMENMDPNDPQLKFDQLGHDVAVNLGGPAILGVEEVQDSNGTGTGVLDPTVTVEKLIAAIVANGGPHYAWTQVSPTAENANGGEPNGNIRNVILYDPTRVTYVEGSTRLLDDNSPANGDSFHNSRKPLVADFLFHGEEVTFVSIHNYSRLGSEEPYGLDQPAINSGDARRTDQTATVRDYVHQLELAKPGANVVVAGDFNGYQFETSLTQLEANGDLVNLSWKLAQTDRYSSTFEGNNEQIDHLLTSANLAGSAQFDIVHVNTNLPYGSGPSDHDPILASLLVNHGPAAAGEAFGTDEDVALVVDAAHGVLANDVDPNGDALHATVATGPAHGTLTLNADGSFEYHADANYNGADSFTYVAADGFGGVSAATTVQLAVAAVNDAPVGASDSATVREDGAVNIDVAANDVDVDGDALTIVLGNAKSALGASLVLDHGQVRYIADADSFDLLATGQSVTDTFTYTLDDGHGGHSAPVTVSVTVSEAGDNQVLAGSNKAGTFIDTPGHDTTYSAGNGGDTAFGGDGADTLIGGNSGDMLDGGAGVDRLVGGNGDDMLFGGAGNDALDGGNGIDVLVGGAGDDTLTGGNGADTFVITADAGRDTITDFRAGLDHIVVGYAGNGSAADLSGWLKGPHAGTGFSFADIDVDGDGQADAVAITGGALGANTVVLGAVSVATLVGQGYLTADLHVRGDWLV
jgi:VCBS repeat-containing protein